MYNTEKKKELKKKIICLSHNTTAVEKSVRVVWVHVCTHTYITYCIGTFCTRYIINLLIIRVYNTEKKKELKKKIICLSHNTTAVEKSVRVVWVHIHTYCIGRRYMNVIQHVHIHT